MYKRSLNDEKADDKGASPLSINQWQAQSLAIGQFPWICTFLATL
jgi:hypothetical protein